MKSALIINGQAESLDVLERALPEDCSVFAANSDDEALNLVRTISVNVVLMQASVLSDEILRTAT